MSETLNYIAAQVRNRETFLLSFPNDFRTFDALLSALRSAWARLGNERDASGRSQVGLLRFVNILVRHSIIGFQHIASFQSFLAWLTFRPGLEALLILGKVVDYPANAQIWQNRSNDREAYNKAFSGSALLSKSLPRSGEFRSVLSRLNDDFMHPNPNFTDRDMRRRDCGDDVILEINFFDEPASHEAHLLAYLNLLDAIVSSSREMVSALLVSPPAALPTVQLYSERETARAVRVAAKSDLARKVMEEIGLWKF